ncbi:hypothetical protein BD410DRAFT_865021 [Rickenella mellea]|uniref:DUF6818 domain-containing protein n=1 Tax=Rickenella mellea TaxID=50990 RepID=A0A4Y7Q4D9_9AGAM|nr:hypothetical protein BD410DRAFT_804020 [Rickenella mellea]TDL22078.1 hypothetical protein BD410DRAFT_865021 [Rickenella mellea]
MSQPNEIRTWIDASGQPHYLDDNGRWVPFGPRVQPAPGGGQQLPGPTNGQTMPPNTFVFPPTAGPNDPTPNTHSGVSANAGPSNIPIDPALVPLPESDSVDAARIRGDIPVPKVAGSRRTTTSKPDPKGKGKQRRTVDEGKNKRKREEIEESGDEEPKKVKGRSKGAANYRDDEIAEMLDLVEDVLPLGAKGWKVIGDKHREWARDNRRAERSDKSLELKYKALVRTTKPTGDGEIPWDVDRALDIEREIVDKSGVRKLEDEDIIDLDDEASTISDNDDDDERPPAKKQKPAVARAVAIKVDTPLPPVTTRRSRGPAGLDVLNRLSQNFDPAVQAARENERTARSLQASQIQTLSTQIRDLNSTVTSLRTQLLESERHRHEAERRADRVEQQLHMEEMFRRVSGRREISYERPPPPPPPPERYHVRYRDGGEARFYGHPEDFDSGHSASTPSPRQYLRMDSPSYETQLAAGFPGHPPTRPAPQSHSHHSHSRRRANTRNSGFTLAVSPSRHHPRITLSVTPTTTRTVSRGDVNDEEAPPALHIDASEEGTKEDEV